MARCLIGCGSNVGSRHDFLDRALELLRFMPALNVTHEEIDLMLDLLSAVIERSK